MQIYFSPKFGIVVLVRYLAYLSVGNTKKPNMHDTRDTINRESIYLYNQLHPDDNRQRSFSDASVIRISNLINKINNAYITAPSKAASIRTANFAGTGTIDESSTNP